MVEVGLGLENGRRGCPESLTADDVEPALRSDVGIGAKVAVVARLLTCYGCDAGDEALNPFRTQSRFGDKPL